MKYQRDQTIKNFLVDGQAYGFGVIESKKDNTKVYVLYEKDKIIAYFSDSEIWDIAGGSKSY